MPRQRTSSRAHSAHSVTFGAAVHIMDNVSFGIVLGQVHKSPDRTRFGATHWLALDGRSVEVRDIGAAREGSAPGLPQLLFPVHPGSCCQWASPGLRSEWMPGRREQAAGRCRRAPPELRAIDRGRTCPAEFAPRDPCAVGGQSSRCRNGCPSFAEDDRLKTTG